MSSTPSTNDRNEQAQATMHRDESSASSEQMAGSSVASTLTPTLPGQILTESDHEDNLTEQIDELIRNFLSRPNRRSPYRSFFNWTFDDEPNLSYSVVLKIVTPSPMI